MESRNPVVLALAIIGALALFFLLRMWLTHGTMMGGMMGGRGMMGGWASPLGILVVVGIVILIVLLARRT